MNNILESLKDNNIENLKRIVSKGSVMKKEILYQFRNSVLKNISNDLVYFLIEISDNDDLIQLALKFINEQRYDYFKTILTHIKQTSHIKLEVLLNASSSRGYVNYFNKILALVDDKEEFLIFFINQYIRNETIGGASDIAQYIEYYQALGMELLLLIDYFESKFDLNDLLRIFDRYTPDYYSQFTLNGRGTESYVLRDIFMYMVFRIITYSSVDSVLTSTSPEVIDKLLKYALLNNVPNSLTRIFMEKSSNLQSIIDDVNDNIVDYEIPANYVSLFEESV